MPHLAGRRRPDLYCKWLLGFCRQPGGSFLTCLHAHCLVCHTRLPSHWALHYIGWPAESAARVNESE